MSCCSPQPVPVPEDKGADRSLLVRLVVAAFFAMMVMAAAIVTYWTPFGPLDASEARALAFAMAFASIPVVLGSGSLFFAEAWQELKTRRPGMSSLVTLGAGSAYLYSWTQLATGGTEVYFDTASMIVLFVLVGRVIESRLGAQAGRALAEWLGSLPGTAEVRTDGVWVERAVDEVERGDTIRVRAGDTVPLDGTVVRGRAEIDRAAFSGESVPVPVGLGAPVEAGSINLLGPIELGVTQPVGSRSIDRLIGSVRAFAGQRPAIQRMADRFARGLVFVALALGVSVVALGVARGELSAGLLNALAVLVIACPCVAGLATPAALAAAATSAARRGVVLKAADAIERLAFPSVVAFDKTGTLTERRPEIVEVVAAPGLTRRRLVEIASAAEQGIAHPIAETIAAAGAKGDLEVDDVRVLPGFGVRGRIEDQTVLVGRADLLEQAGVEVPPRPPQDSETWVHVARGGRWIGSLALRAALRPGAVAAVQELRSRGVGVYLITGDERPIGEWVARQLGLPVTRVHARVTPQDKARVIRELRRRRGDVVYVGDGINDGPALAAADVGVAVVGSTSVAEASAHVSLRRDGAERIVDVIDDARRARKAMRSNLRWAVAYNVAALPFAAVGLVPPAIAALLMAASSLVVLANSARLLRRPRRAPGAGWWLPTARGTNVDAATQGMLLDRRRRSEAAA